MKLGNKMDFGQEALQGLAAGGLPDIGLDTADVPEFAPADLAPAAPVASAPSKAKRGKSDLMPPPELRAIYENVSRDTQVPVNVLIAMGFTESGHRADIEGPETKWGKAGGIMQYLEETARKRGINRFNAEESIRAAAEDLRDQVKKNGGNWDDAIKHHYAGPNRAEWGKKTEAYNRKIRLRARQVADIYDRELDAERAPREQAREEAAANKRAEYYGDNGSAPIANPKPGQKPAAASNPASAGLGGLFGFGEQLAAARDAGKNGDQGVMTGYDGMVAPESGSKSFTPVTDEARGKVRAMLAAATPAQRKALLADKGWQGQVARVELAASEKIKNKTKASGITPGVGQPRAIQTRDEIAASYKKSGYTPEQAAELAAHDLAGHTDQVQASDFDFEGRKAARDNVLVQAGRDVKRGASNLRAMTEGLAGTIYGLAGEDELARSALETAVARMEKTARENPALIGSYENIHGGDDALRYAVEAVAENLPMFLPSLASGGVGGLFARRAASGLMSDLVAKVGRDKALQTIERHIMLGQTAGAAASSIGMETGSIAGDIYQKTGEASPWLALGAGIPAGLLDAVEPIMALRRIAGPVADGVGASIIKRLGVEAGKQFMAEAGTEGLQTIIENAAGLAAQHKQPLTPELLDGVVDAMLKGGIGGGVMGAGSEALGALRGREPAAPGAAPGAAQYAAAVDAAFKGKPAGPIARAVDKSAPVVAANAQAAAAIDLDRPPADEDMFDGETTANTANSLPTGTPQWQSRPGATMGGAPVEVGRKENFASDYPLPPAPDAAAIADSDARVAAGNEQRAAAGRRQILDAVLADDSVKNPAARFMAELQRAGVRDTTISSQEAAAIQRFIAAREAFTGQALDEEPSAPNELGQDDATDWRAQRDAEILGEEGSGLAKLALTAEQAAIADTSKAAGQFIKRLRKNGIQVDDERAMIAAYKEYKANGGNDRTASDQVAETQPAGQQGGAAGAAERPARHTAGMDASAGQRGQQATATANPAGQPAAGVGRTPQNTYHKRLRLIDTSRHSVRDAIAKLGGIRKDEAMREWGATLVEGAKSRFVGAPLFRRNNGGMPLDKMREALAELGYLPADSDINDLYDAFEADSLHHAGQERQAAEHGAKLGSQQEQRAPTAVSERTLDNHPPYNRAYDLDAEFNPPVLLPEDLNEAIADNATELNEEEAKAHADLVALMYAKFGEEATTDILERAAIMAEGGSDYVKALEGLIHEQQQQTAASTRQSEKPAAGKPAESRQGTAQDRSASPALTLESYDQAELDRREQAQRDAEAKRKADEQAAERKRQADAEAGDFVLTGSNSEADQLAARGQGGLFDAPAETKPIGAAAAEQTDIKQGVVNRAVYSATNADPIKADDRPMDAEDLRFELEVMLERAQAGRLTAAQFAQSEFGQRQDTGVIMALNKSLRDDPVGTLTRLLDRIDEVKKQAGADKQGPSDSQAVNDYLAGRRDTPPTVEEVAAESAENAKQGDAPSTRRNGEVEHAAADRLEQLHEQMAGITNRNSLEGNAKAAIRSVIDELRKPKTVSNVVAVLEKASSDLMRKYGAFADVVQEVADSLNSATPPDDKLKGREMGEGGRPKDGKPILPGDVFRTLSGRETTPYPKQKGEKYASQWLIDNAVAEAESRGDKFNARQFAAVTLLKGGQLTPADIDSMQMYLFEQQPPVVKPMLKPLVDPRIDPYEERAKALRQRSEQMGEDGNYPESEKQAGQAYDDFYSRAIDADEFEARLDRIEEAKKDPLNHGEWIILGDGSQQWRFQGMNFGRIEDVRRTDGASQNTSRPWRTSDGEYFENQREAKRHELTTKATPSLQRDGYLPKPKQAADYGANNKLVTKDRAEELRAKLKAKLKGTQLNSGIDPELLAIGTELAVFHIEAGARKFADFVRALADHLDMQPSELRPYLRSWYNGARDMTEDMGGDVAGMDSAEEVRAELSRLDAYNDNATGKTKEQNDAPATSGSVEQDSRQPGTAAAGQRAADGNESAGSGRGTGKPGRGAAQERDAADSDRRVSGADDAGGRAGGNQPVHQADGQLGAAPGAAGRGQRSRGAATGSERLPADTKRAADLVSDAESTATERVAREKSQDKAPATFIAGDLDNIRATLPALLPEQQDDVLKAEQRFARDDGHGMMFTNGTGTGKTYTGGGIAKRFDLQGKSSILAVAPSQDILKGWQAAMERLGVKATVLGSTSENGGSGMVLTTYANLGANQTLAERQWDLVIADESHKLMQSEDGSNTSALSTLRAITHHPAALSTKARMILRDKINKMNALANDAKVNRNSDNEQLWGLAAEQQAKADALAREIEARTKELVAEYQQQPRSKVVFLSATPFSYHFTLDYANGYLFDYGNGSPVDSSAYNSGGERERFFMQHFGYRMRYNKLTRPKAGVNSELLEREFHEKLRRDGSLSGRKLTVAADYDRKFVLVDSGIGQRIDEALKFLSDTKDEKGNAKYRELYNYTLKKFDYLSRMRLLEAIKAEHAVDEIKQHQALGRKVVVFHDYNSGGGFSPFNYDALVGNDNEDYQGDDEDLQAVAAQAREQSAAANAMLADEYTGKQIREQIAMLKAERPDILQIDFSKMKSPLATLTAAFPNALVYNGTVPARDRVRARELFNKDGSGFDLIVVQSAAGEAGISLHDTTGKHQRVLLNLGMPIRPVTAIQQEGRIYRVGQVTDAIMRYMTTGTGWEDAAFASKIAGRAGTAENLGMGNEARALRQSFIDAYTNASEYPASAEDGKGGKQQDSAENSAMSPFERSKTYYYAQQKNTKRRDQREGKDYFATPEPIGFKMVELANLRPFERALEPSAGHGAIARFLPESAARTLVEPSGHLAPKAAMAAPGAKLVQSDFESLHLANKYDAIVMNPPYGSGGSTAIAHVAKAAKHLRNGGRIVALIPRGGMADKRFDSWLYGDEADGIYLQADIALPGVAFENAGTSVATRIVVLEKQTHPDDVAKLQPQINRDYSDAKTIAELFDRIEQLQLRERVAPTVSDGMSLEEGDTVAIGGIDFDVLHGGKSLRPKGKMGKDEFAQAAALARQYGGSYDSYDKAFSFASAEKRSQWAEAFDRGDEPTGKAGKADNSAKAAEYVAALQGQGLAEVKHITGKGKELTGYVVDLPLNVVKERIDKYTFRKDGGLFVRKEHAEKLLQVLQELAALPPGASFSVVNRDRSGDAAPSTMMHFRTETGQPFVGGMTEASVSEVVQLLTSRWKNAPRVTVVQNFESLPAEIQQDCRRQGGHEGNVQGVYSAKDATVYVVAENHEWAKEVEETVFHEIVGHHGLHVLLADANGNSQAEKLRLYKRIGGRAALLAMADDFGPKVRKAIDRYSDSLAKGNWPQATQSAILFDELIAHIAENQPSGWQHKLRVVYGQLRDFMRRTGFAELATMNSADIAALVHRVAQVAIHGRAPGTKGRPAAGARLSVAAAGSQQLQPQDLADIFNDSPLAPWIGQLYKAGKLLLRKDFPLPASFGKAAVQGFAAEGKISLIANNIPSRYAAMAVLLHEVFHNHGEALLGTQAWNKLLGELGELLMHARQFPNGKAGQLWAKAAARVSDAAAGGFAMTDAKAAEELGAYAIEHAELAPATWQRWVSRLLGHVKAWVRRTFGVQLGRLTPEQLRALAIAALKDGSTMPSPQPGTKFSVRSSEQENISMRKGNFPGAEQTDNVALGKDVQRKLEKLHPGWADRLREAGLSGLRTALAVLPGNAVVDIYADRLPALRDSQRFGERLDGMRQMMQKEADHVFRSWQKLPQEAADKMADLMHEATIWQLHPDQAAPEKLNKKWLAKHAQLAADWDALPAEAQQVYRDVRDLYAKRTEQMFDALAARIDRIQGLPSGSRSKMLAELRQSFDKTMGKGPYFPLSRFGDFLVIAKRLDDDGKTLEKIVLSAETEFEQKQMAADLARRGFDVVETDQAKKNFRAGSMGADMSEFAVKIIDKLDGVDMDDEQRSELLDDINQMLIDALPPASARKHFKHRKGVPGFSNDAVRAFVRSQSSMASHIANITYQDRIDGAIAEAYKQARADQQNVNELAKVVQEMEERAAIARQFTAAAWANALTSLGFANFLGFSLSQGLLNLTQVPVLTYPALAAKFGEANADKALASAYAKVGRALVAKGGETVGDVRALQNLDQDSKDVLAEMEARGKLDLTMSLDLARAGGGPQAPGRNGVTKSAQWVGRYMGWFNHVSEAANRQITAMAAYQLALQNGMTKEQAFDYTAKLLDDSQFNYAFSNRPRMLMSNGGRVLGMMHTFGINMMYRLGRNLYHAVGDWKGQEGKQARAVVMRMLAVQIALAGVSSLPLLPLSAAVAGTLAHKLSGSRVVGAIGAAGGAALMQALIGGMLADDDEPWDWEAERRALLNDIAGSKTVAEILDKGLLRMLGVDVANRISMNDLLYRDFGAGYTTTPAQTWLDNGFTQLVGGAAYGAIKQYGRAIDYASNGQYHRAAEAALPKFAADLLKASRYAREDVRVPVGATSAHRADVSAFDVVRQAMGFTPAKVAEVNAAERVKRNAAAETGGRRLDLLDSWVNAKLEGDLEGMAAAMKAIAKYNATQRENGYSELAILPKERLQKLRSLRKSVKNKEAGKTVSKRYRDVAEDAAEEFNAE